MEYTFAEAKEIVMDDPSKAMLRVDRKHFGGPRPATIMIAYHRGKLSRLRANGIWTWPARFTNGVNVMWNVLDRDSLESTLKETLCRTR